VRDFAFRQNAGDGTNEREEGHLAFSLGGTAPRSRE
jgi:hypothetical protein